MQRFFGAKKKVEEPIKKEVEIKEEPKPIDLVDQSKKVYHYYLNSKHIKLQLETRIQEVNGVVNGIDKELRELYPKMKAAKGSSQSFYKQRILNLMKKRKMCEKNSFIIMIINLINQVSKSM